MSIPLINSESRFLNLSAVEMAGAAVIVATFVFGWVQLNNHVEHNTAKLDSITSDINRKMELIERQRVMDLAEVKKSDEKILTGQSGAVKDLNLLTNDVNVLTNEVKHLSNNIGKLSEILSQTYPFNKGR